MKGPCYPVSEALYHLLGGKEAGWTPQILHHEGISHWYLKHQSGMILDLTVSQFKTIPDYSTGIGKGFRYPSPSKRARTIMEVIFPFTNGGKHDGRSI